MKTQRIRYIVRTIEGTRLPFYCISTAIEAAHKMADRFGHDVLVQTPKYMRVTYRAVTRYPRIEKHYDVNGRQFSRIDLAVEYAKELCRGGKLFIRVDRIYWDCGAISRYEMLYQVVARKRITYEPILADPVDVSIHGRSPFVKEVMY